LPPRGPQVHTAHRPSTRLAGLEVQWNARRLRTPRRITDALIVPGHLRHAGWPASGQGTCRQAAREDRCDQAAVQSRSGRGRRGRPRALCSASHQRRRGSPAAESGWRGGPRRGDERGASPGRGETSSRFTFRRGGGTFKALRGSEMQIREGEILGMRRGVAGSGSRACWCLSLLRAASSVRAPRVSGRVMVRGQRHESAARPTAPQGPAPSISVRVPETRDALNPTMGSQ